jgi:hypothetical protein
MRVGELLIPIAEVMRRELLGGSYIQADETTVDVQMHDGRGQNHQAYFWQYGRPGGGAVFEFRLGRGRDGPKEFLGQFEGILQTDGYGAYDRVGGPKMVHACCWAHYPDSGIIWSCRPNGVPDGVDKQRGGHRPPDNTAQSVSRNARSFGEGLHRRRVRSVRPERFQKASSTSRFILRLVVMYRLVVATEACPR